MLDHRKWFLDDHGVLLAQPRLSSILHGHTIWYWYNFHRGLLPRNITKRKEREVGYYQRGSFGNNVEACAEVEKKITISS